MGINYKYIQEILKILLDVVTVINHSQYFLLNSFGPCPITFIIQFRCEANDEKIDIFCNCRLHQIMVQCFCAQILPLI